MLAEETVAASEIVMSGSIFGTKPDQSAVDFEAFFVVALFGEEIAKDTEDIDIIGVTFEHVTEELHFKRGLFGLVLSGSHRLLGLVLHGVAELSHVGLRTTDEAMMIGEYTKKIGPVQISLAGGTCFSQT
jgi:hypothetical protein